MIISLTQQESDKFSFWLKQEAESDKMMFEQFKKLHKEGTPIYEALEKKYKTEIAAKIIVANILDKTERMSVGG